MSANGCIISMSLDNSPLTSLNECVIIPPERDDTVNQKGNEPMRKQQSVRFEPKVNEWLAAQAKKQKRAIAEIIRMIVDDAIENKWGE